MIEIDFEDFLIKNIHPPIYHELKREDDVE